MMPALRASRPEVASFSTTPVNVPERDSSNFTVPCGSFSRRLATGLPERGSVTTMKLTSSSRLTRRTPLSPKQHSEKWNQRRASGRSAQRMCPKLSPTEVTKPVSLSCVGTPRSFKLVARARPRSARCGTMMENSTRSPTCNRSGDLVLPSAASASSASRSKPTDIGTRDSLCCCCCCCCCCWPPPARGASCSLPAAGGTPPSPSPPPGAAASSAAPASTSSFCTSSAAAAAAASAAARLS
mmetsp:Transcript_7579/g.30795  ORF Transcript_7579/g.30795 Transcript_7579/m.30795 type:complete len:241 (-) Transcript_7579:439-1161(-)